MAKAKALPQLGDEVKDILSGVKGIAISKATWMYGCVRFKIQVVKKGSPAMEADCFWADSPQVQVVKAGTFKRTTYIKLATDIELGDKVKSLITEFEGIVTCVTEHLFIPNTATIQGKSDKKNVGGHDGVFFFNELRITEKGAFAQHRVLPLEQVESVKETPRYGPRKDPKLPF